MSHVQYRYTTYFYKSRQRNDRKNIKFSWIRDAIENPTKYKVQDNNRISVWKFIKSERKCLRVILMPDGRTIHNAYFDRDENRKQYRKKRKNNDFYSYGQAKTYSY